MKTLLILFIAGLLGANGSDYKMDFDSEPKWTITNDGVMGGLSKGKAFGEGGNLIFEGFISLDNNGGFSWAKSPYQSLDLSDKTKVKIKYKSDDRGYDLTFETPEAQYVACFKKRLEGTGGKWKVIEVDLEDCVYYFMGQTSGKSFTDRDKVQNVGFLLADKAEGNFHLEVAYIEFF